MSNAAPAKIPTENEQIVNEILHDIHGSFADISDGTGTIEGDFNVSSNQALPRAISYASLKCRRGVSIKPPSPSPGPAPSRLHHVVFVTGSVSSMPDYLRPDRIIKTPVLFSSRPPSCERLRCGGSGGHLATTRRLQVLILSISFLCRGVGQWVHNERLLSDWLQELQSPSTPRTPPPTITS